MGKLVMAALFVAALVACEDRERLCGAIAQTRESALQPRDRIYWEENCVGKDSAPYHNDGSLQRRDDLAKKREQERLGSKARLAKMAQPYLDVAARFSVGDDEAAVKTRTTSLAAKPVVAKGDGTITYSWRMESGMDRCRFNVRLMGKSIRRVEVQCQDLLAGAEAVENLFEAQF